ncbi:Palmitoyl-CoA hydrolase [Bordetella tumbae]|uniref:acyl-CoA thioester hydrolase/BAAT C-terminal domain-containing protein n=1 Tax=Bordetella tumbae TaxID=1649139 RepID=UPI0039EF2385
MSQATLSISPVDDLIDVPRQIRVEKLTPGQVVEISTRTVRDAVAWTSQAQFRADENGIVDLTRDAPVAGSGSYDEVSPMGLIWSQAPESASRNVFNTPVTEPLVTQISVRGTDVSLGGELVQRLAADGVTRREVREDGLVGVLYLPPGPGPHPAVMILNGSGGGFNEPRAALYASRGYAALSLAYFKAPGLSDYISNTPLEYFQTGMDWIRRELKPAHDFVAISGQSRGGELVLLLGAAFPEAVSAVVAYVPGAVVHSGQNACDPKIGREGPTWLLGGKPVPHVWEGNRTATWAPFDEGPAPHRHEKAILTALQDPEAVARARIPVERIQGPVMLLSGTEDGSWPSTLYSRMVRDSLREANHPYPVQWLDYEGGGHTILFPYVPTTQLVYAHPVSGRISTSGGSPSPNARADAESWPGVLAFLRDAVAARASGTAGKASAKAAPVIKAANAVAAAIDDATVAAKK